MSERRLAKSDGAKLVKNSGRGEMKGDAVLPPFLIDYKEYTTSFSINKHNWNKHATDAWKQSHREPLISVVLDGELRLAVLDWNLFMEMREYYLMYKDVAN